MLDKMTHNVHNADTLPENREQRTQARLLSIGAQGRSVVSMIWVIGQQEGRTTFSSIQTFRVCTHKNMTFKNIGKINYTSREGILFSEFINIYVAAQAPVFRKYFAELVPVFI